MRRSRFLLLALASLALAIPLPAHAGAPLTGTTSCDLQGRFDFRPYLPFQGLPSNKRVRAFTKVDAPCDGTNVSGSAIPMVGARVIFKGKLPAGTDCGAFFGTVPFEKSRLKVHWHGSRANGRVTDVATSVAPLASASFDSGSGSVVMVTEPITAGAFAGSIMTMTLHFGDAAQLMETCSGSGGAFSAFVFDGGPIDPDGTWTLTVP